MITAITFCVLCWIGDPKPLVRAEPVQPEIHVAVRPTSCLEPCSIKASITITGYEETREVCFALFDEEMDPPDEPSRRSCWPWNGRKITDVRVGNIPAGTYRVVAELKEAKRKDTARLLVGGATGAAVVGR